jgi:Flp pilus assembly protein TadB
MGRRRGGGGSPQIKGFRPGKEPKQLRTQAAKQQFGEMNAAQERMVEFFAERTPEQSRKLLARWRTWSAVAGVVLSALSVWAWMWHWIAGVVVGALAAGLFLVHLQLRSQRASLEAMADAVAGGRRKR